jgi:molybdate transport system substrate-binding protein
MVEAARDEFEAESPGKSANVSVLQPMEIVERVEKGEVPDIVVLVGEAELTQLEQKVLLDRGSRQSTGDLALVIAVPKGNPGAIHGPGDLSRVPVGGIAMSLAGMTSLGTSAKREFERAGLWDNLQEKLTVTRTSVEALRAVAEGEVDAGLLYDPCPRLLVGGDFATDAVETVSPLTSPGAERITRIHAELHKRSPNALLAQRFLRLLVGGEALSSGAEAEADGSHVGEGGQGPAAEPADEPQ